MDKVRESVAPPTPPICQDWMPPAMSARGRMMATTKDEKVIAVAVPAKASLRGVAPSRPSEPIV